MGHVVRTAFAALAALVVPCATLAQDYPKKPMLVILPMQSASASDVMMLIGASIALATAAVQAADAYPEKPVRFVVPFPPGGGTDGFARILGSKLTEFWNQQIVIDSRAGAQGSVGTAIGAKAAPDGYTLVLAHSGSLAINPHLYSNPGYDTLRDFTPVSGGVSMPFILVVHPSVPVTTTKELAALARQNPGNLSFASTSAGPWVVGELFKLTTKTDMWSVPCRAQRHGTPTSWRSAPTG